jgi:uncharacterized membrane protein YozB (DUF420 family)
LGVHSPANFEDWGEAKMTGPQVILGLKVAVLLVTLLLAASMIALAKGKIALHGRINLAFFVLTLAALFVFEGIIRMWNPEVFEYIKSKPELLQSLRIHLGFSVPSALLMPLMLWSGLKHNRRAHIGLGMVFLVLWAGTFITGIFFLPHN